MRRGSRKTQFFGAGLREVGVIPNGRGRFEILDVRLDPPHVPPLKENPDLPISKTLRSVLGLLTVMILKRVSESIFFQSNKFTVCKVRDGKEAKCLMVFNLYKIIYPF